MDSDTANLYATIKKGQDALRLHAGLGPRPQHGMAWFQGEHGEVQPTHAQVVEHWLNLLEEHICH
jgi:hypothetical protein